MLSIGAANTGLRNGEIGVPEKSVERLLKTKMNPLILLEISSRGVLLTVCLNSLYSELNLIDKNALLKMTRIIKGGITLKNTEWLTKLGRRVFEGSSWSFCHQ